MRFFRLEPQSRLHLEPEVVPDAVLSYNPTTPQQPDIRHGKLWEAEQSAD